MCMPETYVKLSTGVALGDMESDRFHAEEIVTARKGWGENDRVLSVVGIYDVGGLKTVN